MKFHELTSGRLAAIDREQTLVIVPIAAVEQHGPHMPTGTDFILCQAVAAAVEKQLPEQVLLTPAVWLGASAHHLRLGSTLDSALDTYIATLCDIARSLLDDGYLRLLFLNGHGGNIDPMRGGGAARFSPLTRNLFWRLVATGRSPTNLFAKRSRVLTNTSVMPVNSKRQ